MKSNSVIKKLDNVGTFGIRNTLFVSRGIASSMLGPFVIPKVIVITRERNPVILHGFVDRSVSNEVLSVVVDPLRVTIGDLVAIAGVWPKAMDSPFVLRDKVHHIVSAGFDASAIAREPL